MFSQDSTVVSFDMLTLKNEIFEEIDVITPTDLIGNLGGSLGMFLGFSMSGFVFDLIKWMFKFCFKSNEV